MTDKFKDFQKQWILGDTTYTNIAFLFDNNKQKFAEIFDAISHINIYHNEDLSFLKEAKKGLSILKNKSYEAQDLLIGLCDFDYKTYKDEKGNLFVYYVDNDSNVFNSTLEEYVSNELNKSKYTSQTLENEYALKSFREAKINEWLKTLKKEATYKSLPDRVIDSYIENFGKEAMFNTFRGEYEYGIKDWLPEEERIYNKSYSHVLKNKEKYGIPKNKAMEYFKNEVYNALYGGESVKVSSFLNTVNLDDISASNVKLAYNSFFAHVVENEKNDASFIIDKYGAYGYELDGEKRFLGDSMHSFACYDFNNLMSELNESPRVGF